MLAISLFYFPDDVIVLAVASLVFMFDKERRTIITKGRRQEKIDYEIRKRMQLDAKK